MSCSCAAVVAREVGETNIAFIDDRQAKVTIKFGGQKSVE